MLSPMMQVTSHDLGASWAPLCPSSSFDTPINSPHKEPTSFTSFVWASVSSSLDDGDIA